MRWNQRRAADIQLLQLNRMARDVSEQDDTRQEIYRLRSLINELRRDLDYHKITTKDQYNSAYARTAERYYESSLRHNQHLEEINKEMLQRWQDHAEALKEKIEELKKENDQLREQLESRSPKSFWRNAIKKFPGFR